MANEQENLDLNLNITNQQSWEEGLKKAQAIAEETAAKVDDAFSRSTDFVNKFGNSILKLEQNAVRLQDQFVKISQSDLGKEFEQVNIKSRDAALRLSDLILKLEELDRRAQAGKIGKSVFQSETEDIKNEIAYLERLLVTTKELTNVQRVINKPPGAEVIKFDPLQLERQLQTYQGQFARLATVGKGAGFEKINEDSKLATAQITRLIERIRLLESETSSGKISGLAFKEQTNEIKNEIVQIERLLLSTKELHNVQRANTPPGTSQGGAGSGVLSQVGRGLGIPYFASGLGVAAGIAAASIAFQKFNEYLGIAIDRGSNLIKSNRQLSASASELGVTYGFLTDKNKQYAATLAESEVNTAAFTSRVAQLVARTAQPQRLDTFAKGLLDLGAARGLDNQELVTVVNQIITGQDEAYKKLGIRNPQVLYKEAAQQQGRSVESFSQIEKQIIYQDEILKKSQLFSGAAEARLNSIDGQINKTKSQFENLANTLSLSAISSRPFFDLMNNANSALKAFGDNVDDVKRKLSEGASPAKLAEEGAKNGIYGTLANLASAGTSIFRLPTAALLGGASAFDENVLGQKGKPLQEYNKSQFLSLYQNFTGRDIDQELYQDELQRRNLAFLKQQADQKKVAEDQTKALEDQRKEDELRRTSSQVDFRFNQALSRNKTNVQAIEDAYREFLDKANEDTAKIYFNDQKMEEAAFKKGEAVSNALSEGFRTTLGNPYASITELQQGLFGVQAESRLTTEDKDRLVNEFEKTIKSAADKIRGLRDTIRNELFSYEGKDNQFIGLFSKLQESIDKTDERAKILGKDMAAAAGAMEQGFIKAEIAEAKFLSNLKALDFDQQAVKLKGLLESETDGFQRNLQFIQNSLQYVAGNQNITRQIEEATFYASQYNPANPKNFQVEQFRSRFGASFDFNQQGTDDFLGSLQKGLLQSKEALDDIAKFNEINTLNTGVLGRGAIADEILKRIPTNDILLNQLQDPRTRFDAQQLLNARADALVAKKAADDQRFQDLIHNQEVAELTRKQAQEKVDLLRQSTGVDAAFTAKQLLSITSELGPGELTPELRNARLEALRISSEEEKKKAEDAETRMNEIKSLLDNINTALTERGIKIDTSTNPLLDVNIHNNSDVATSVYRPNAQDASRRGR